MKENIFPKEVCPRETPEKNRQEKRESILGGLREKVEIIKGIKKLIDETRIDEEPGLVSQKLNGYKEQIFNRYSLASEKIKEVDFLEAIKRGIHFLLLKFRTVQAMKENERLLIENLGEVLFPESKIERLDDLSSPESKKARRELRRLYKDKVRKVIFNPFGITLVLEKKYFDRVQGKGENLSGFHIPGSVFSIVKEQRNKHLLSEVIDHEDIHNLIDGFSPSATDPLKMFQSIIKRGDRLRKLKAPPSSIEQIEKRKKEIFSMPASKIIDMLHQEILADIYLVEQSQFLFKKPYLTEGERRHIGFTTAQYQVNMLKNFFKRVSNREINPEIKSRSFYLSEDIDKAFDRAISFMRRALFISRYTRDPLEVHSLLLLLKPSKFHHLETYLRNKYGEAFYDNFSALYKCLTENDLSLETVKAINNIKNEIRGIELFLLRKRLENIKNVANFVRKNYSSLEERKEYWVTIESLNSRLKIRTEEIERLKRAIFQNSLISTLLKIRKK